MWVPQTSSGRAWLAASVTAVSVGYVGYSLGIFKHAYISWRARKLPGWWAQRNSLGRLLTCNMADLFGQGVNKFHVRLKAGADEHGGLYRARILCFSVVVITDPKTVQEVLRPGPNYCPKLVPNVSRLQKLLGSEPPVSIVSVPEGAYHRAIRKALSPAFSPSSLKRVYPEAILLADRAVEYIKSLGPRGMVDIDNMAQRITVDLIGRMVFSIDFKATQFELHNEPLEITNNLFKTMQNIVNPLNRWLPWRKEGRAFFSWQSRYFKLAESVVDNAVKNPPGPDTIMHALLNLQDPNTGKKLTKKQLRNEVALLLLAGFETTAHSIAWTLLCLVSHEEALQPVLRELDELGLLVTKERPSPRAIEWSDLGRMKELDAAVNEGLRLFPTVSSGPMTRQAPQDLQLLGHVIPKGIFVMMPTWAVHRSKAAWGPDAEEYKPQRWLEQTPEGETPARKAAFMPFSHGPRDCVGQSLAMLELRAVLATLLGRVRFELAEQMVSFKVTADSARQFMTLQPTIPDTNKVGLLMRCTPRV